MICSGTRNLGVSFFLFCDAWVLALSLYFFQVNFSQFQSASVSQEQAWPKLLSRGAWLSHVCLPPQPQQGMVELFIAEGDLFFFFLLSPVYLLGSSETIYEIMPVALFSLLTFCLREHSPVSKLTTLCLEISAVGISCTASKVFPEDDLPWWEGLESVHCHPLPILCKPQ